MTSEKLFSLLRYLDFYPGLFSHVVKRLSRKLRLISKFMTSQTVKPIIAIHILPNISRSKGNQTMKFGQLIENKVRNIFLRKSYSK